jgi:septal ring factor EnvC (AmiA/AmiB activator)
MDWTVRFGDVLVMVSFLTTAIITGLVLSVRVGGFSTRMDFIQKDMGELKDWQKAMQATLTAIAVQQSKIAAVERRLEIIDESINDIRHGRGFIVRHLPDEDS